MFYHRGWLKGDKEYTDEGQKPKIQEIKVDEQIWHGVDDFLFSYIYIYIYI